MTPPRKFLLVLISFCFSIFVSHGFGGKLVGVELPQETEFTNRLGMKFRRLEPGTWEMGNGRPIPAELRTKEQDGREAWLADLGDFDERPVHRVRISHPYFMAVTEVTNQQYEKFDRLHAHRRGQLGFSIDDTEAVVFVSWYEAQAFCDWLAKEEGLPYRLPTEAEWEYACRAGTNTHFATGETLPDQFLKNPDNSWFPEPNRGRGRAEVVPIHVGQTPANPWGLFDMHGNVEEWCADWYGPYPSDDQVDPQGYLQGDFKVCRGGSHSTFAYFMRSANRMGTLPESRSWYTGFRVALGPPLKGPFLPPTPPAKYQQNVRQSVPVDLLQGPDPEHPYYLGPRPFVKIPPGSQGPLFDNHNHDPDIAECPNGDLLAIWYTTETERGRELAMAASRLRFGELEWDEAAPFWDAPDRNDHAPALLFDGKQTLYHFNSLSVAATWGPLAILKRISTDNGVTWSRAQMIVPEYRGRNQVVSSEFLTREGYFVLPCDATPNGEGGTALHISQDGGQTWQDSGGTIAGIHAGVTQLPNGTLIAFGRGDNLEGQLPKSVSTDMGKTWKSTPSGFPPIGGGQRCVLRRLNEGPLMLGAFANPTDPIAVYAATETGEKRRVFGFYLALSYDGGETWPHVRPLSNDRRVQKVPMLDGSRGNHFMMSATQSEPKGYFAVTQARNGVVHLISSWNHYAFNLAWLQSKIQE